MLGAMADDVVVAITGLNHYNNGDVHLPVGC